MIEVMSPVWDDMWSFMPMLGDINRLKSVFLRVVENLVFVSMLPFLMIPKEPTRTLTKGAHRVLVKKNVLLANTGTIANLYW